MTNLTDQRACLTVMAQFQGEKGLAHIHLPDGRELEKMELTGEAEPGGRSNKAGE